MPNKAVKKILRNRGLREGAEVPLIFGGGFITNLPGSYRKARKGEKL